VSLLFTHQIVLIRIPSMACVLRSQSSGLHMLHAQMTRVCIYKRTAKVDGCMMVHTGGLVMSACVKHPSHGCLRCASIWHRSSAHAHACLVSMHTVPLIIMNVSSQGVCQLTEKPVCKQARAHPPWSRSVCHSDLISLYS